MSKDPAILLYTSDFLTGTMLMTHEQVGKYIRLLCIQHQKGHLRKEDINNICQSYDKEIFSKFVEDENGLFYNVRLDMEVKRRKAYSESRRKNRAGKGKKAPSKITHVKHMETETENETINETTSTVKEVGILEGLTPTQMIEKGLLD